VWKLWEELSNKYPLHFEFIHSYGLGVLQLSEGTDSFKLDWLQPNSSQRHMLLDFFSATGKHINKQYDNQELKSLVLDRDSQIAERDAQIAGCNTELLEIRTSKSWRTAMLLRRVRVFLFPQGSWLEYVARRLFSIITIPIRLYRSYKK
jgi:hypothetical protein